MLLNKKVDNLFLDVKDEVTRLDTDNCNNTELVNDVTDADADILLLNLK